MALHPAYFEKEDKGRHYKGNGEKLLSEVPLVLIIFLPSREETDTAGQKFRFYRLKCKEERRDQTGPSCC